jgi:penicillin-binding protein 1A
MAEPGLYALVKILAGGMSATLTGPLGPVDLPDIDLAAEISANRHGYVAEVLTEHQESLGYAGQDRASSPRVQDLPDRFIQALLSIEDARFGAHPGVDPMATAMAILDTVRGNPRGGSTITQQVVKNSVTGNKVSIDRKVREAILAVRAQEGLSEDVILEGYLGNAWFGRGQSGATGASLAWFGKQWSEVTLSEAAFLAGILKGPAYYDPIKNPEQAKERRDLVLRAMFNKGMINEETRDSAIEEPLTVLSHADTKMLMAPVATWIDTGVAHDVDRYGIMDHPGMRSGDVRITTTIDTDWQALAQEALRAGVRRISPAKPVAEIDLPTLKPGLSIPKDITLKIRQKGARHVATSKKTGRALIYSVGSGYYTTVVDRGYGDLEWHHLKEADQEIGFKAKPGDLLVYKRVNGLVTLQRPSAVQGAVVVMRPEDGAILASIGSSDPDLFPLDRTQVKRQPGSAIKPFAWLSALNVGWRPDEYVEDRVRSYHTNTGDVWTPKNYDGAEAGLVPLFVALEESSNLAAASLIDSLGVEALASTAEAAGIYEWGEMKRIPASVLGVSETSLTRLTAGYAALANGGKVVAPHRISRVIKNGETLWSPLEIERNIAISTSSETRDLTSMLYGVVERGTAHRPFRKLDLPVVGKTGTTQNYRDAWFVSYTPGVVVGVWVGMDDNSPLPGKRSGSSAAAPIARDIYAAARRQGLLTKNGRRAGQPQYQSWPPQLFDVGFQPSHQDYNPIYSQPENSQFDAQQPFKKREKARNPAQREDSLQGMFSLIDGRKAEKKSRSYFDPPEDALAPQPKKKVFRSAW